MESERNIEKLLRTLARKRHDEADAPELHPANRRLLQAEVARRYPRRKGGSAWRLFQMQPALFGLGAAAAVALLAALLLPALSKSKSQPQTLALRQAEPVAETPPAPVASPQPLRRTPPVGFAMSDSDTTTSRIEGAPASEPRLFANVLSEKVAPDMGMDKSESRADGITSARVSEGESGMVAFGTFSAHEESTPHSPMKAGDESSSTTQIMAASSPVGPASQDKKKRATTPRESRNQPLAMEQRFVQVTNTLLVANDLKKDAAAPHSVLADFKLEQKGRRIRIIDGDGSVYEGSLPDLTVAAFSAAPAASRAIERSNRLPVRHEEQGFRVEGTNRTLQQQVVFTGNLITSNPIQPIGETNNWVGAVALTNAHRPITSPRPYTSINGSAVIGAGSEILIEARPAATPLSSTGEGAIE